LIDCEVLMFSSPPSLVPGFDRRSRAKDGHRRNRPDWRGAATHLGRGARKDSTKRGVEMPGEPRRRWRAAGAAALAVGAVGVFASAAAAAPPQNTAVPATSGTA